MSAPESLVRTVPVPQWMVGLALFILAGLALVIAPEMLSTRDAVRDQKAKIDGIQAHVLALDSRVVGLEREQAALLLKMLDRLGAIDVRLGRIECRLDDDCRPANPPRLER